MTETYLGKAPTIVEQWILQHYSTRVWWSADDDNYTDILAKGTLNRNSFAVDGHIATNAFKVKIGNSVTSIASNTFTNCSNLTSVSIPGSVTTINPYAFTYCNEQLYDRNTVPGVVLVDGWAIQFTQDIGNVLDLTGARGIEDRAFSQCENITDVIIPDSMTSIGNEAFYVCTNLSAAVMPDSIASIGSRAFMNCTELVNAMIPNKTAYIGNQAFQGCTKLENLTIPDSVRYIKQSAFLACSGLKTLSIPDSIDSIEDFAFFGCSSLETAMITRNGGDAERVRHMLINAGVASDIIQIEP